MLVLKFGQISEADYREMPSHQKSSEINSVHIKTEFHYFYEEETQ